MKENTDSCFEGQSNLLGLFYTIDKSIQTINDTDIMDELLKKYPKLDDENADDGAIRKTIVEILENEQFVNQTLKKMDITILDLISTLFRKLNSVFSNPQFIKKVKSTVVGKSYAAKYQ